MVWRQHCSDAHTQLILAHMTTNGVQKIKIKIFKSKGPRDISISSNISKFQRQGSPTTLKRTKPRMSGDQKRRLDQKPRNKLSPRDPSHALTLLTKKCWLIWKPICWNATYFSKTWQKWVFRVLEPFYCVLSHFPIYDRYIPFLHICGSRGRNFQNHDFSE